MGLQQSSVMGDMLAALCLCCSRPQHGGQSVRNHKNPCVSILGGGGADLQAHNVLKKSVI